MNPRPPFSKVNKPGNILHFKQEFYVAYSILRDFRRTPRVLYEQISELDCLLLKEFTIMKDSHGDFFTYASILQVGTMQLFIHECKLKESVFLETQDEKYPITNGHDAITEMYQILL